MNRLPHLNDSTLVSLVLHGDDSPSAVRAGAHLGRCTRCRGALTDLRALRDHLAKRWAEPSEGAVARAMALVAAPAPRRAEWDRFRLARLIYDSRGHEPAYAVRAAATARHQLWRLPEADLDLRLEGPGVGAAPVLLGQVLPRGRRRERPDDGTVWIVERGARARSAVLGGSGEFTLPAPRSERWVLWLEWGSLRLRVVRR